MGLSCVLVRTISTLLFFFPLYIANVTTSHMLVTKPPKAPNASSPSLFNGTLHYILYDLPRRRLMRNNGSRGSYVYVPELAAVVT